MHLLRGQHFIGRDFPGVKDLTFERHDRLIFAIARLLGGTARRIPFDKEQLGPIKILRGTVRQFPGNAGPLVSFCAPLFCGAQSPLRAGNRHLCQLFRRLHVLVQPQAEGIFHHAGNKCRTLTRRQTLFSLPGKLRVLHFHGEHISAAIPDIFRRQFDAARQNIAVFAKFAHRVEQALAQTVDVRPPCMVGIRLT